MYFENLQIFHSADIGQMYLHASAMCSSTPWLDCATLHCFVAPPVTMSKGKGKGKKAKVNQGISYGDVRIRAGTYTYGRVKKEKEKRRRKRGISRGTGANAPDDPRSIPTDPGE